MNIKNKKTSLYPTAEERFPDIEYKYRLLKDLMDNIPDVIYFKDKKGRLMLVNSAHAKGLGLKPEEVIGKTDFDIFPRERAQEMFHDDQRVLKTGRPIVDKVERATRVDGVDNYVSTTKIPRYDQKKNIIGLIGITRDITHRMQLKQLEEEKQKIKSKLDYLSELNKVKSELVSVVSHELRTPLAIIKDAVSIIKDGLAGSITDKQEQLLLKAGSNILRLQHIIEELLDISRIETGKLKLHYSLVDLSELVTESADFFKKITSEKGISLKYRLPKHKISIFLDPERISQVINNLLDNAVKFTDKNGRITIEIKVLESKVRICVADTGMGISKRDLSNIFNKFVQVSKLPHLEKKGVGLGLSIIKGLVQQCGGEIWAESSLGSGSRFYFTLPRPYNISNITQEERNKLNSLIKDGRSLHLVNLNILSPSGIEKNLNKRLFLSKISNIISLTLKECSSSGICNPEMSWMNSRKDEHNFVLVDTTENKVNQICQSIKRGIDNYSIKNKLEDIFITWGGLNVSKSELTVTKELFENFYLKKIYIGVNKRRFQRVSCKMKIEIFLSSLKQVQGGQTIDISLGGICFLSKKQLNTDELVNIELNLPEVKNRLTIRGRVAWVRIMEEGPEGSEYKIGVEFLKLKKNDRRLINAFIKSASK